MKFVKIPTTYHDVNVNVDHIISIELIHQSSYVDTPWQLKVYAIDKHEWFCGVFTTEEEGLHAKQKLMEEIAS